MLARLFRRKASTSQVTDDTPGWTKHNATLDQPWPTLLTQMEEALEAWRRNPLARRIVDLTSSYVVATGISVGSTYPPLQRFINRWWYHPLNNIPARLKPWCDELTRAGEIFPVLNRAADGMSYIRMIPASQIHEIRWLPGDYESETEYLQVQGLDLTWWTGPHHPNAPNSPHLMLHYAINRPIGCVRGESDLGPLLPWLKHYSRWLEDRVRLNWSARVWLWMVRVPANKVEAKRLQYSSPPDPGSIIVHDDGESWDLKSPNIQARDAAADGKAMRYMIAAGAGLPLHMLSEADGTNVATAKAQTDVTARHLRQRQQSFIAILTDLTLHAYEYWRTQQHRPPRRCDLSDISVSVPEINREDNLELARASLNIVQMLRNLRDELAISGIQPTHELNRRTLELAFRFAGETLDPDEIQDILGL